MYVCSSTSVQISEITLFEHDIGVRSCFIAYVVTRYWVICFWCILKWIWINKIDSFSQWTYYHILLHFYIMKKNTLDSRTLVIKCAQYWYQLKPIYLVHISLCFQTSSSFSTAIGQVIISAGSGHVCISLYICVAMKYNDTGLIRLPRLTTQCNKKVRYHDRC